MCFSDEDALFFLIFFGQIIATSRDLTPNGGLVREIPLFQGSLGWWSIIIWPDFLVQQDTLREVTSLARPVGYPSFEAWFKRLMDGWISMGEVFGGCPGSGSPSFTYILGDSHHHNGRGFI